MAVDHVEKTIAELDEILTEAINEHKLPGLSMGIIKDGELVAARYLGSADLEEGKPVTNETIFRIGSISKTFTGVGIMQLVEQGRIDLDEPVNTYLTSYQVLHKKPQAPPVTVRHMMTHVSGIGELASLKDIFKTQGGLGAKPEEPFTPLAEMYAGVLRPEIYPEKKIAYCNHAFATLGQIIEDVSGVPFAEYMREHVFAPLGMHDSDFLLTESISPHLANAYDFKNGKYKAVEYTRIEVPGAGSIFSRVEDMAKYVSALMNEGANEHGRIVHPGTLETMFTPQLDLNERLGMNFGLYFVMTKFGEHRIAWHNGGWPGFVSSMWVAPDDKLGVVVFTNTSSPAPDLIAMKLMRKMLNEPDPVENIPDPQVLAAPHDWPSLCGHYAPSKGILTNFRILTGFGGEMQVLVKDNKLMLRSLVGGMSKGVVLHKADNSDRLYYQAVAGPQVMNILFTTDEEGKIDGMQMGAMTFYKRPVQQSLRFKAMVVAASVGGSVLGTIIANMLAKRKE